MTGRLCPGCGDIVDGPCPRGCRPGGKRTTPQRALNQRVWGSRAHRAQRRRVWLRDDYTCIDCGWRDNTEIGDRLVADHVHGIHEVRSFDDDELATRCRTCSGRKDGQRSAASAVVLVALMGAPGAGKSTLATQLAAELDAPIIGLDEIREGARHVSILRARLDELESAIALDGRAIFDSCLTASATRRRVLTTGQRWQASTRLVYVTAPLAACIDSQRGRAHPVPDDVVVSLHRAAAAAWASSVREGWSERRRVPGRLRSSRVEQTRLLAADPVDELG